MTKGVKTGVWIAVAAVVFFAALTYSMMGLRKHRVEVCMEFNGNSACRIAAGETVEKAQRAALDNACALIARGMGDSMACQSSKPVSVRVVE